MVDTWNLWMRRILACALLLSFALAAGEASAAGPPEGDTGPGIALAR